MVDVSKSTLEHLDELLGEVSEGMDGPSDWPPPQEKECMTVAALNLLNLQVWVFLSLSSFDVSIFIRYVRKTNSYIGDVQIYSGGSWKFRHLYVCTIYIVHDRVSQVAPV